MATRYHLAAKELRGALRTYAKHFGLLEVPLSDARGRALSLATLRRYRREVAPSFEFSVVLPPAMATPRPGPALDDAIVEAHAAIHALGARCVLLRTSREVTPSPLWRNRIAEVLERLERDVTAVAWEPSGLWEYNDICAQAAEWGVVPVVDPLQEQAIPKGPVAYVRLRALGETRGFGAAALERLVNDIGDRRDAYVVLEATKALDEAKTLRRLVAARGRGLAAEADARVLRPRVAPRPIRIADDEQE